MSAALADVNHRGTFTQDTASRQLAEQKHVISDGPPVHYLAFNVGDRFGKDGSASLGTNQFKIAESWFIGAKASSEVSHHVRLRLIENVDRKAAPFA
jgi:hypothetical protein